MNITEPERESPNSQTFGSYLVILAAKHSSSINRGPKRQSSLAFLEPIGLATGEPNFDETVDKRDSPTSA
jgi:hypothetical protein